MAENSTFNTLANIKFNEETRLGELPMHTFSVNNHIIVANVEGVFRQYPELPGVIVTHNEVAMGVISRRKLFEYLGQQYGVPVYKKRPIQVMLEDIGIIPMVLSADTHIHDALYEVLERPPDLLLEPLLVRYDAQTYQLLDVYTLLMAQSQLMTYLQGRLEETNEQLEERVQRRTTALERANQALQNAHERLIRQEKLAFMGQLVGGIGHELRNPLSVIWNAIQFLQMVVDNTNEEMVEYLQIIADRSQEIDTIIHNLLKLAKPESIEPQDTVVSTFIEEILQQYPPPDGVTVLVDVSPLLPPVLIDKGQIRQALINLITNAYQAILKIGQVNIVAYPKDDYLILEVQDNGIGMPPEIVQSIFEPLFTTKQKGIGFGLTISKNLVEANNGRILVDSVKGQGSTFTLILPINHSA